MIVRDEEAHLEACLAPVAPLFDEVVIVDTGSRDGTRRIARTFTSQVFDVPWRDDFAAARNAALQQASCPWIFWLDADDRLDAENRQRLAALMETLGPPRVYLMDTICLTGQAGDMPRWVTHRRLFPRDPRLMWKGRVHEQLRPDAQELGWEEVFSDVQIQHLGYQDQTLRQKKLRRKLRLLQMEYAVQPDDPSTLLHLAMAYLNTATLAQSRQYFQRLCQVSPPDAPHMRRAYLGLADLALHEGKIAEALSWVEQGLRYFPGDEHLLLAGAMAYFNAQAWEPAKAALQAILQTRAPRRMLYGECCQVREQVAPRMLAAILRVQGALPQAQQVLQAVLSRFPDDLCAWYNLGLVFLDARQPFPLEAVCTRLEAGGGRIEAAMLRVLWQMRYGDLATVGPLIDQLVAQAPDLPIPRMLRAEWLSRTGAPWTDQMRALRDVLRVQPGNEEARQYLARLSALVSQAAPPLDASAPPLPAHEAALA
jgi:tetratricopeptide (TPR) repeat protein